MQERSGARRPIYLTQVSEAQNAQVTVNGVASSSQTNSVKGALPNATLNLTATGSSNLTVAKNTDQIGQNISNLVTAYNDLNATAASPKK
jgi:flagellar hook-associated protein 2